jgi:nicotinate-nucleotide adenylyltransferase
MKARIGILGGTFDPVHLGHIKAAEDVRAAFRLDKVLFIPSYIPPHKTSGPAASAVDRLRMVELACRGHKGFVASAMEVAARETSYSILTLARIRDLFPDAWVFFMLGIDAFLEIGTWREYDRVLAECLFVVMDRPGFELESARGVLGGRLVGRMHTIIAGESVDDSLFSQFGVFLLSIGALAISSTSIRTMIERGESLERLVPGPVEAYIKEHQLYISR